MSAPAQANLFTSKGETAVDPTFATALRTRLDAGSWVEIVPRWLSGADALLARVVREEDK